MDWNKFFLYKLGTRDLCNEHQRPGLQGWPLPDRTTDGAKVWVYIGKPFWARLQFILLQRKSSFSCYFGSRRYRADLDRLSIPARRIPKVGSSSSCLGDSQWQSSMEVTGCYPERHGEVGADVAVLPPFRIRKVSSSMFRPGGGQG
jgi:hypothetical protein